MTADDGELIARLRAALIEYAEHGSWRCAYRSRYERCVCGLDDEMRALGLEPVAVHDPEAERIAPLLPGESLHIAGCTLSPGHKGPCDVSFEATA